MTFRCAGPVFWPLGNHAEAKANAPGLPRQTSRPRVEPPEPGAWGLPPDCRAPCACWCPHLPTADRAATAQLALLPEVQPCHLPSPGVVLLFPLSHFQPGPQGQPCWWELSMFTENLSILPPWICSILGTLYSALPPSTLLCLAPSPLLQDFICFLLPAITQPRRCSSCFLPKLCSSHMTLSWAAEQTKCHKCSICFSQGRNGKSSGRWACRWAVSSGTIPHTFHFAVTWPWAYRRIHPDSTGKTAGKYFCSGPYGHRSESRHCLLVSCVNVNIIQSLWPVPSFIHL